MELIEKIAKINPDFAKAVKDAKKGKELIAKLRENGVFPKLKSGTMGEAKKLFREKTEAGLLHSNDMPL